MIHLWFLHHVDNLHWHKMFISTAQMAITQQIPQDLLVMLPDWYCFFCFLWLETKYYKQLINLDEGSNNIHSTRLLLIFVNESFIYWCDYRTWSCKAVQTWNDCVKRQQSFSGTFTCCALLIYIKLLLSYNESSSQKCCICYKLKWYLNIVFIFCFFQIIKTKNCLVYGNA